jgi:phenylacetate-coenzyme A ligase PaaK-like adenylate-forming protein
MSNMPDLVANLNRFQPYEIRAFASMAALLAAEQLDGRLQISPRIVWTALDVCTSPMRARIRKAWDVEPYDTYGMVEAGSVAGDCAFHRGLHIFDDLFIYEVVDHDNRTLPAGQVGSKVLLTNLFNYTLPLIRLEVSDVVTTSPEPCPCGIPFPLLHVIEGRTSEVLVLPAADGADVHIHPSELAILMERLADVREYQFVRSADDITLRIAPLDAADRDALQHRAQDIVEQHLRSRLVAPVPVHIEFVDRIVRDPTRGAKHLTVISK